MAKTLKLQVNFGMSIVVNTQTEKAIEIARAAAREAVKQGELNGDKRDSMVHVFASDKPTEEVLEIIIRSGIRGFIREDLVRDLSNDETRASITSNIDVTYEKQEVPGE